MAKKLISKQEVKHLVGFSDSTRERLEKRHLFPKRIKVPGSRRTLYLEEEIHQYVESLKRNRDISGSLSIPYTKTWRAGRGD